MIDRMKKKGERSSFLDTPIQYLKGVGPKRASLFSRIGVATVRDLLYLKPRKYLNRKDIKRVRDLVPGEEATVFGEILTKGIQETRNGQVLKVILKDNTGWMELLWFHLPQLEKLFKVGDQMVASGKVTIFKGIKQMIHPEYEVLSEGQAPWRAGRIIPVYPATEGLKPRFIHRIVERALEAAEKEVKETLPPFLIEKRGLMPRLEALRNLHLPEELEDAERARVTLAYEEFLYFYLQLLSHRVEPELRGIPFNKPGELAFRFVKSLPFKFTEAQRRVLKEIEFDLRKSKPMHRLLQGDVGSGKTVVALYAMVRAFENGYQTAMMAPTEILAEQHYIVISEMLKDLDIPVVLLTGKMKKREKEEARSLIESGDPMIVIGTHALIQEDVSFKKLALAIVDEQHRFGVLQRSRLREKGVEGAWPHFLVMTATPIPRTLAMTLYGDLDVSILDEKPPGRPPITTRWVRERDRDKVYGWLFDKVRQGHQAYVVAPLVEKSEKLEVEAAIELHEQLLQMVPEGILVGLIHGRMKPEERREVMKGFRDGKFHILVATTVIEVGIDVPTATIMVIEHAERFGLAQLHQLRGRIGRGKERSFCILLTKERVTEEARLRLEALVRTSDGFEIAEVDLRIRGPGQLLGTRQHGMPEFKVGDLLSDQKILHWARQDAKEILEGDPHLEEERHTILKENLIMIKERREALYVA
jgi:ATP-dependent DNA helicase RecG